MINLRFEVYLNFSLSCFISFSFIRTLYFIWFLFLRIEAKVYKQKGRGDIVYNLKIFIKLRYITLEMNTQSSLITIFLLVFILLF